MNDIIDIRVGGKDLIQLFLVGDVALDVLGPLAADELDAVDAFLAAVVEVVDNNDLVVGFEEGESGEGADVAGATGMGGILLVVQRSSGGKNLMRCLMVQQRWCAGVS